MKNNLNENWCFNSTTKLSFIRHLILVFTLIIGISGLNQVNAFENDSTDDEQQQEGITGTVVDSDGNPIPGVTVYLKGTSTGSITDIDGKYSINVEEESSNVLVFSFVGMVSQEVELTGQSNIDIVLMEDSIGLEEVVAVGYATQKRVNLTGSVATIKSDDLVRNPVANTTNAITGRLPGVITKQTSGEPGKDGTTINIRGFGSPLIIVDGIARSFSDINAEEIESMSVLKDASAAIYGSRAGNGVILITTKRGSQQKTVMQYKNSFSFQGVANYPGFVNSGQYAELYREAEMNDGVPEESLAYSEEDIANYYAGAPGYSNGDWWGATIKDWTPQQQHSLSVRGGAKGIRFYGFLGYTGQKGMYTSGDNRMDRYNLRSNIDIDITKNLSASIDVSGKIQDLSSPVDDTQGVFTHIFNALPVFPTTLPDADKVPYSGKGPQNPAAVTTRDIAGYNDENSNKYQTTLRLNYKVPFIEGLSAKGRFDYFGRTTYEKNWRKAYDLYTYDEATDVYVMAASEPRTALKEDFARSRTLTGQFSLDYERTFNSDHMVKGLFVYEAIDTKGNDFWAKRQEFLSTAIEQLFASGIENQDLSGGAYEDGRISYIGRVNYAYKGKYLLEGSFRYDGSNRFTKENRWGFFPSVSAAWRVSEEGFMDNSWLDNLKIRTSYSQSGRDDTGKYQFLTGYEYGSDYIINDILVKGIKSLGVPNEDITWETMTTYNAGFDLSILESKLFADFDIFYRLREGMLATRVKSLPNTIGASLPAENLNSQSNRGFELSIGHTNKINDFSYTIKGLLSWARAKWEGYDEPAYTDPDDIRINQRTGQWTNLSYGYQAIGFFESQEEIDAWPLDQDLNGNITLAPGDIKYLDLNEDDVLDWRDKDAIGRSGTPEIMYGFIADLKYKGFDFSLLLQGSAHHYIEMQTRSVFSSSFPKPFNYMYDQRWEPGKEDALYPRTSLASVENNTVDSDFWIKPASYLRLKSVSLGYSIPQDIINKAGFSGLRVFVAGENLLTFSKLSDYGFDPESPKDQSGKYYPQMQTVSCGLTLTF